MRHYVYISTFLFDVADRPHRSARCAACSHGSSHGLSSRLVGVFLSLKCQLFAFFFAIYTLIKFEYRIKDVQLLCNQATKIFNGLENSLRVENLGPNV